MDKLDAEIAKRKAMRAQLSSEAAKSVAIGKRKKYVRKGDLERLKEIEEKLDADKKAKAKAEAEEKARASGYSRRRDADAADEEVAVELPYEEAVKRLRRRGQPITLFGETHADRLKRLAKLEDEAHDDLALGEGFDIGNAFLKADERKEHARSGYGEDDSGDEGDDSKPRKKRKRATGGAAAGAGGEGEDGEEEDAHGDVGTLQDFFAKAKKKKYSKMTFIAKFFKQLLKEWEHDLANRPPEVKRTAAGKIETRTHKQCKDYVRPFFKKCRSKDLEPDICEHIYKIVKFCENLEYLKASDQYVQLAIGNAPWPIGVTSVGIHDRAARHKISQASVAHVLNDECQRKYITSLKRLMSYCQKKYPSDPSKMMA